MRGLRQVPRSEGRRLRRGVGAVLPVLQVLVLVLVGCSGGASLPSPTVVAARPSSPVEVSIDRPANGAVLHGSNVPIVVEVSGGEIVPTTTSAISPTRGHLHVSVDDRIVSMNFGRTDVVRGVAPGLHVLQVEFVASDHLPFEPRVISRTTFEVER